MAKGIAFRAALLGGALAIAVAASARPRQPAGTSARMTRASRAPLTRAAHAPTGRPARTASVGAFEQKTLAWQIALEREGFSPGLIDGRGGPRTALATREFQESRGLNVSGQLDEPTAAALGIDEANTVLKTYTITDADQQKVAPPPKNWLAKSKAKFLGHNNLAEAVAERFHCSRVLLATLNPSVDLARLRVGQALIVPAVLDGKTLRVHRLEVDLSQKAIRGFDGEGRQVALFHCSIASKAEDRPKGEARVLGVANDPHYLFDPKVWPEVKGIKTKLLIPPGPKNPVGLCWIGLSLKGYGIHGTPNPELIGKSGSHGCLRLTNWDAIRLGKMVGAGTPVKFTGGR